MFLGLFSPKRRHFWVRGLHLGKKFSNPNSEDIVFKAICVNLRQNKLKFLDQISPTLTNSTVTRVFLEFRSSTRLVLEFNNRIKELKHVSHCLESCSVVIHAMIKSRQYDDALCLMKNSIEKLNYPPLTMCKGLIHACDCSSSLCISLLVKAYIQIGSTEAAYKVIQQSKIDGFRVSIRTWNELLNHLLNLNEFLGFWEVYREMISYGYIENLHCYYLIIHALCKELRLSESISIYYKMLKVGFKPNVVAFNILINGASRLSDTNLALKIFMNIGVMSEHRVNPNLITFNCLINGFCKIGHVEIAEELCDEMTKTGLEPNVRTYATIIDGHSRNGNLEGAFRHCNEMVETGLIPNVVVYNSLLHWLYKEGDLEGADLLLQDMVEKNVLPDKFTYAILTKGICKNGNNTKETLRFFKWILEEKLVEDTFLHNILIDYLCKTKNVSGAKQVLSGMIVRGFVPDLVTFGTLIDGFCKEGDIEKAVECYYFLINSGKEPNSVIYNSILNGFCREKSPKLAKSMAGELKKRNLIDSITFNTLLHGFCSVGEIQQAMKMVCEMKELGVKFNRVSYNIVINFLCKLGLIEEAKKMVEMMVGEGLSPDNITYTTIITNVSRLLGGDKVVEIHDFLMLKGVVLDEETYKAIVRPLIGDREKSA